MPQMFPTPFLLLMASVGLLALLGVVRLFWYGAYFSSPSSYISSEETRRALAFNQLW